jgi:dolichyl-phosphate beta-glucosyltransferase
LQENTIFFSIIIPAYNEQERIAATLERVERYLSALGKPFEIIVVDDGSSDGMLSVVNDIVAASSVIRIVSYKPNHGKGYAVRQGVAKAQGEYIAFSDADLSAPIEEMDKLFAAIEKGSDIAIGSRAIKGAEIPVHQPLYRELGGKALNFIIRAVAVPGIRDTQCGFKLFRGDVARELFAKSFLEGWGFDVEILFLARKAGYNITEAPVKWSHSEGSKIHPFSAAIKIIGDLIRVRLHRYK